MSGDHHTIELPSTLAPAPPDSPTAPHDLLPLDEHTPTLLGELTLPAERESVPHARRFSRSVTTVSGIDHLADDAEVLVSELVTNAVRNATAPGSVLCLKLLRAGPRLRVEVHDRGGAVPRTRPVDLMEETGRAWFLIAVMAERHGTDHTPSGTTVWCELRAWPRDDRPGR